MRCRALGLALVLVATALAGATLLISGAIDAEAIAAWLRRISGPRGMALYVLTVVLSQFLWAPRLWGLLAGGLLFGPLWGGLLSFGADLTSAIASYSLSRYLGAEVVRGYLRRRQRLEELVDLLAERRGMVTMLLLRVLPFHYTASSHAAGLARVPWGAYLIGTALGTLPGTVIFCSVGSRARDPRDPWFWVGAALVLVTGLLGLYLMGRVWQRFRRSHRSQPES